MQMPSHDQIKYAKDFLSVVFMLIVGGFIAAHLLRGGTFRPVVGIAGVAS
jgi:hypothetical protein